MNAADFTAWMEHMVLNVSDVSRTLGLSRNTVTKYMAEGAPAYIGYACAALAFGLPKWAKA